MNFKVWFLTLPVARDGSSSVSAYKPKPVTQTQTKIDYIHKQKIYTTLNKNQ